jgi:methyl-accepting chemotaxis protein
VVVFTIIFITAGVTFVFSMRRNVHSNASDDLIKKIEIERMKLETSLNSEIVIVLKMAGSPLLQQFFLNPENPQIRNIAHNEISSYRSMLASNTIFWANDIDKVFWFNDDGVYVIDPDNPEDYWYNMTLYDTERYNFNINYNPEVDVTNLWINAPVFDQNRRPIGIVGTGIELSSFINSIYENYKGSDELYFFNTLNEITGARDRNLVSEKINLENVLGEIAEEVFARINAELNTIEAGEIQYFSKGVNIVVFGKVPSLDWHIIAVLPITLADTLRSPITVLFIAMMAVTAAIFLGFYLFIAGLIHRTTSTTNHVFNSLKNNDLTVNVDIKNKDEIGDLLTALGDFLKKLRLAFKLFNEEASTVSSAVNELSASSKEIAATANEQATSVAEIVSTVENNNELSGQIAVNIFEVTELAEETRQLSQRGADLHGANEEMMADIRKKNAKIVEEIKNLHDLLSRIDESVEIIDTIADKTKLIAFNAALEASSSGEAGLRFAVVAGEIRRFTDNVEESVLEIKERITELQSTSDALMSEADIGSQAIDSGYYRMLEQKEVYSDIVEISQNVAVRSQQISSLSKQQELASAQVFTTLKEISAGTRNFVTSTESTTDTVEKLNSISIELKEILSKYRIVERRTENDKL